MHTGTGLERAQSEWWERDCGRNAAPRGQPRKAIYRLSDVFEDLWLWIITAIGI